MCVRKSTTFESRRPFTCAFIAANTLLTRSRYELDSAAPDSLSAASQPFAVSRYVVATILLT